MESCPLQSSAIATIPTSLSKSGFLEKPLFHDKVVRFPTAKRCMHGRKLKSVDFRAQASGPAKVSSGVTEAISSKNDAKDDNLAFVAGATGRVGSRTVRELLKLGYRVRAGVRSAQKATSLVQSVKEMKLDSGDGSEGVKPIEKLELVECDLEKQDRIVPALGNASVVICCIGASEKEVFDITGPYRIDYQATKNLIDAATIAKAKHFIMVSSLGTNKVGFPAVILNLFWGVLIWKRKAEEALIASGLPYTIVRPGGMERPTDAYKKTHNIFLSTEDTLFGGQVSNLQVAELIACMARNRSLSYCKVVEVIAETTAPVTPMEQLLRKIPSQRPDISSPQESDAASKPVSVPPKKIITDEPTAPTEKEPDEIKAVMKQSLSPYAAYDDLKPPTSPTPTPPSVQTEQNAVSKLEVSDTQEKAIGLATGISEAISAPEKLPKITRLSPYAAYEGLKPPTSPTPTPSTSKKELTPSSGLTSSISETIAAPEGLPKTTPLSPYAAYEDLKPPTSPTPRPSDPKEASASASSSADSTSMLTGGNDIPKTTESSIGERDYSQNSTYRSPFPVYEDMKPPTSPTPSPLGNCK